MTIFCGEVRMKMHRRAIHTPDELTEIIKQILSAISGQELRTCSNNLYSWHHARLAGGHIQHLPTCSELYYVIQTVNVDCISKSQELISRCNFQLDTLCVCTCVQKLDELNCNLWFKMLLQKLWSYYWTLYIASSENRVRSPEIKWT
jgi:hypothetical protein